MRMLWPLIIILARLGIAERRISGIFADLSSIDGDCLAQEKR